jgi:Flp pilus assembly protein TadG
MMTRRGKHPRSRGAAMVEFAIILPLLLLILLWIVDFCRIFYAYTIITDCARNGVIYAADSTADQQQSPYYVSGNFATSVTNAALADATNLTPTPTVTVSPATPVANSAITVTVTYQFGLITNYFGFKSYTITRSEQMNVSP